MTFPSATVFSPRNLRDMKRFCLAYTDKEIRRQAVAKLARVQLDIFFERMQADGVMDLSENGRG